MKQPGDISADARQRAVLPYATPGDDSFPLGSKLRLEHKNGGIVISARPANFGLLLAGWLFQLFFFLALESWFLWLAFHSTGDASPAIVAVFACMIFGFYLVKSLRRILRRRGIGVSFVVANGKLTIVTPAARDLQHEFPLHDVKFIVKRIGFTMRFRPYGGLAIEGIGYPTYLLAGIGNGGRHHQGDTLLLEGWRWRELQWVAATLNRSIDLERQPQRELTSPL